MQKSRKDFQVAETVKGLTPILLSLVIQRKHGDQSVFNSENAVCPNGT